MPSFADLKTVVVLDLRVAEEVGLAVRISFPTGFFEMGICN